MRLSLGFRNKLRDILDAPDEVVREFDIVGDNFGHGTAFRGPYGPTWMGVAVTSGWYIT